MAAQSHLTHTLSKIEIDTLYLKPLGKVQQLQMERFYSDSQCLHIQKRRSNLSR